jgi:acetate kinase
MAQTVLVVNAGSSSIKYQLVDLETSQAIASGLVEAIKEPVGGHYQHVYNGEKHDVHEPIPDFHTGFKRVLGFFDEFGPNLKDSGIIAVGHRVVQGGWLFPQPALATKKVIQDVKDLAVMAPLHNGPEAVGIEAMKDLLPDVPQYIVFDSSFFFQLPPEAKTYALNKDVAEKYHIERYGAHGTSHEYVGSLVPGLVGKPAEGFKQIVLHIGNGASASAQISGKPIDTSMGLTPLEGLVMGGRTGDIDPAVVFHLIRNAHMDVDELDDLFNHKSGMTGLTGYGDLREVHKLIEQGNKDAKLALDIYVHRIVHYIGAYWAELGGLDAITFTAGVGEHDEIVRAKAIKALEPFGVKLDEEKNNAHSSEPRIISTPDSKVAVCVIPTNEELAIARKGLALVKAGEDSYGNKVADFQ